MKPGKFILDWDFKVVDLYDLQTNKCLIELDKRFIDREELKEKINKIITDFTKSTGVDGREIMFQYTDTDLSDLRAYILKLLK